VPAIYQLIVYWMIGLGDTAGQFFTMYFILVLEAFMGTSLGLFVGSIITDSKGISGAVTVMLLPFIVLAGFFKNPANMSHWFGWIQYISPFKYGFIGLLNNEVGSKASLIDNFNFDFDMWPAIMMLLALGVAMRIIALYVLWAKKGKL
jgi:ABC-type multidrug transport system permease subunit